MKKLSILAAAAAMTASSLFAEGIQINKHLNLSGFVDMSYQNVDSDVVGGDRSTFSMDQAELDFTVTSAQGLSARVDIQATPSNTTGTEDVRLEQARIDYAVNNWTLTMGRFDTFIGLEALEPTELYQYSNSLVFALEPTQHTGIALGYDNGFFNGAIALANSLTPYNQDNNDEIGVALHAGLTPNKAWSFNLNYATSEEANGASFATGTTGTSPATGVTADATLLTADISWSNYGWTVGFEYANHEVDSGAGMTAENTAWSLMANYAFTERFALTGRYSVSEGKTGGDISEFTISPSYAFTENWSGLLEIRSESWDTNFTGTNNLIGGGMDATIVTLETTLKF